MCVCVYIWLLLDKQKVYLCKIYLYLTKSIFNGKYTLTVQWYWNRFIAELSVQSNQSRN